MGMNAVIIACFRWWANHSNVSDMNRHIRDITVITQLSLSKVSNCFRTEDDAVPVLLDQSCRDADKLQGELNQNRYYI